MDYSQPRRIEERLAYEVVLIIALAVLALAQVTLLPAPLGFPPPLLLILVICRILLGVRQPASNGGVSLGLRWALYGGLALDIYAVTPLGSHALALLAAATLVFPMAGRLRVEGPLLPLLSVLLGSIVYEGVLALIYISTVAPIENWTAYGIAIVLPSVLMCLILTLPIFFGMRWFLFRRHRRYPEKQYVCND
jgi:rod shape-determining protein MreD